MKITIVMGFFLPVPPVQGGAVEKSWHRLAMEFVRQGHEVTMISRRWAGWPQREDSDGIHHLRLPGFDHRRQLWLNLVADFSWSLRVQRHLPEADIVVLNTLSLPCWLGRLKPRAGRVVVMPGRMPKGQFRLYSRLARVLAPSSPVREAVIRENAALAPCTRVIGYPISWATLAKPRSSLTSPVTIGYIGRVHEEKGLHLLMAALEALTHFDLPPWRAVICGPVGISQGGSGKAYLDRLKVTAGTAPVEFRPPVFEDERLEALYRELDLFCYPSLSARGETFGVAVAEAMAAGAVPVVSDLPCFRDFVRPDTNGLVFDATAADAVAQLTHKLASLVRDHSRREALGAAAQLTVQRYDFPLYAGDLLADFAQLTAATQPTSSPQ